MFINALIKKSTLLIRYVLLCLLVVTSHATLAQEKTKYEFTDTRISQADTLLKYRQYEEALAAYQAAYNTYEQESFYEGMVYAKERMGRAYRGLGEDSLSALSYNNTIQLSRYKLGTNHFLEAKALVNNGIRIHRKQFFIEASNYFDSATWALSSSKHVDIELEKTLVEFKYYSYYYSGLNSDTLLSYLRKREKIYEKTGMDAHQEILLYSDYSRAYYKVGSYQKSVAYGIEAVRRSELAAESIHSFYYADAFYNLARSMTYQNHYDRALRIVDKLLAYVTENYSQDPELLSYYNLKGIILNGLEEYKAASKQFEHIIQILQKEKKTESRFYRDALMNLGVSNEYMGLYSKSEEILKDVLVQEKAHNNNLKDPSFALRYRYLGKLYNSKKDYEHALAYYDSALRSSLNSYSGDILEVPKIITGKMTYETLLLLKYKQMNMVEAFQVDPKKNTELLKSAIRHAELTHNFLNLNREKPQASEGRLFISENFKSLYESALNSLSLLQEIDKTDDSEIRRQVFQFLNLSKANLFLEQAGELELLQRSRLGKGLKAQYFELQSRIDSLDQIFNEQIDSISTSKVIRSVNTKLMNLNHQKAQLRDSIEVIFGKTEIPEVPVWEDLFEKLANEPDRALVEYFVGEEYIFVLGLSHDKSVFKRIKRDSLLDESISRLIKSLSVLPDSQTGKGLLAEYDELASHVYQSLIKEVLDSLGSEVSKLTIIPDEQLSRLPFEALVSRPNPSAHDFSELNYLLKQYTINYALSSERLLSSHHKSNANKGVLGIGYGNSDQKSAELDYGSLPGARQEISYLLETIPGEYLTGEAGTKQRFIKEAEKYDVLHLAIHGKANQGNRYESSLIFNGTQNNELRTSDLYVANIKARLAVLSACETGSGEIIKGEGTFSIARGFALVGVPSIVMSLWQASDGLSTEIIKGFYDGLLEEQTVATALRDAKLSYLESSDNLTSHPFYWATFVALGQDQRIDLRPKTTNELIFSLLGATVILALIYGFKVKKRPIF